MIFADNMTEVQRLPPSVLTARKKAAGPARDGRHRVRAGPLRSLVALLREQGVEQGPLLGACGLAADALDDDEHWLPFDAAARLLRLAAEATGLPDFGLRMAERCDPAVLGVVARNMQLAPTVGAALMVLRRDFHLHDRGAVPYVADLGDGCVALGYALSRHDTEAVAVTYDLAIGIGLKLLQALCGSGFTARQVSFAHRAPKDARPHRRFFGAPLVFDAAHTQIEFDAAWLARPLPGSEAAARAALQHAARGFDADMPRSLGERVRSVAQTLLMSGSLSEPRIAAELGLHSRNLRRKLAAEGMGVQALIDEVRDQLARQLLAETRLPLADIALALQYTDVASFARAFKRRIGVPPGRWRMQRIRPPAAP
jgi:AraC-like DNA-binding protein